MDLTFGHVVGCGSLQARVEFATKGSARLNLEESEYSDIEVPRPVTPLFPERRARTFRGHRHIGRMDIHLHTDGYFDVYATLFLDQAKDADSFSIPLFHDILEALGLPGRSFELTVVCGADIAVYEAGVPNRPMFLEAAESDPTRTSEAVEYSGRA